MTVFSYVATDLITGKLTASQIPLTVQNFSMQLNGPGTLEGSLDLTAQPGNNAAFVSALTPRRSVLWVLEDGWPVWSGIVWDWQDSTRSSGELPIEAQTVDSIFDHRIISANLSYTNVDLFTMFMDLVTYAMTKNSSFLTGYGAGNSAPPALVRNACAIAGIKLPAGQKSGVLWTQSFLWSDLAQVSEQIQNLVSAGDIEYVFQPGMDNLGNLTNTLQLAYTRLGRSFAASGFEFTYPGNVLDYGYGQTGSQSANYEWGTGTPNGNAAVWVSQYPHGVDVADLQAGFPLLESSVDWQGSNITGQAQVNTFADGEVAMVTQAMTQPVLIVGGGAVPKLAQVTLGDSALFQATSPLHPPGPLGVPGLQATVRITGWECTPTAANQPEKVQFTTSAINVAGV